MQDCEDRITALPLLSLIDRCAMLELTADVPSEVLAVIFGLVSTKDRRAPVSTGPPHPVQKTLLHACLPGCCTSRIAAALKSRRSCATGRSTCRWYADGGGT